MRTDKLLPVAAVALAAVAGLALLVLPSPGAGDVRPTSPAIGSARPTRVEIRHHHPVVLPVGGVTAGAGSAKEGPAGLPLGFARTNSGAVAAATAWLTVVEGSAVLDATRRPVLLSSIGEPAFTTAATNRIAARAAALGLDGSQPPAGHVIAIARPDHGAFRVLGGKGIIQVEIWYPYQLALLTDGAQPGPATWQRVRIALRWNARSSDWRLTRDFTFAAGPTAVGRPSFLDRTQLLSSYGPGWHRYAGARE
jgi:hypothetical protein